MDATLHAITPPLPDDRRIVRAADVPGLAKSERLFCVVGAGGAAPALVAHALALSGAEHVIYLAPNGEAARRAAFDLTALGAGLPLPAPYGVPSAIGAPVVVSSA